MGQSGPETITNSNNSAHSDQTAENAATLGINPEKGLLIGGESSGAVMSIVVSHLCRDEKMLPPLTGVYAPITSGVTESTVPEKYRDRFISPVQNAKAPLFTAGAMEFVDSK